MKKFFSLLLFLPLVLRAQSTAKLDLHFEAALGDTCELKIDDKFIEEYNQNSIVSIKDNRCSFKSLVDKPTLGKLYYNKQSVLVFLEPEDAMELNISNDSLYKSITFSGKGSEQNNFLTTFYKEFHEAFNKEKQKEKMLSNTVDAFEMNLFSERKKQLELFNNQDKTKFSKSFNAYMEATIKYQYFGSLLSFPITNANVSTSILKLYALPEVMLEGVSNKLINDDLLNSSVYRDFVVNDVIYFTSKANGFNKFTDYNTSMERKILYAKSNLTGKTLTWYIANFLNNDCDKVAPYTVKLMYKQLTDLEGNGSYSKLIKTKCDARIKVKEESTSKGDKGKTSTGVSDSKNPFEGVVLKDATGKVFNPKDIEGKVVFVDFWASWCGPCRQEFPYSKKLHDRFTEKQLKNIVFLYISIDGNEATWKNAIQTIGMQGLLLISPGDWSSPIVKHFGLNSIPRYMLIDKKGKVANMNAPRPSSGDDIYNEILKLLAQ